MTGPSTQLGPAGVSMQFFSLLPQAESAATMKKNAPNFFTSDSVT